jgi:hypothetical protein
MTLWGMLFWRMPYRYYFVCCAGLAGQDRTRTLIHTVAHSKQPLRLQLRPQPPVPHTPKPRSPTCCCVCKLWWAQDELQP